MRCFARTMAVMAMGGASLMLAAPEGRAELGGSDRQSESIGAARSGSAIDKDRHSGEARSNQGSQREFQGQPPGIGEKGSGQSQSTMERSGGQSSADNQIKSQGASELSEGKTAKAMEEQMKESR